MIPSASLTFWTCARFPKSEQISFDAVVAAFFNLHYDGAISL